MRYGLELYKKGSSSRIILSIGRFDWRKFCALGHPTGDVLVPYVYRIPAQKRHFFLDIQDDTVQIILVKKQRLGTWTEAQALASYLKADTSLKNILFISDQTHLKRVNYIFSKFIKHGNLEIKHLSLTSWEKFASDHHTKSPINKMKVFMTEYFKLILYIVYWQLYYLYQIFRKKESLTITLGKHNFK